MAQVIAPEVWQEGIEDNRFLPSRYTTGLFTGNGVNIANNEQACRVYDMQISDYITNYDDRRLNGLLGTNTEARDGWGASAYGVFQDVRFDSKIYTMGRHRSVAMRIFDEKQFEGKMVINPALSADGSMVAFQIPGKGIYSCTVAGENVRFITKGSHPAWLPDGKTIVYTDVKDDGNRFTESYIMAVNTATMASVQLAGGTDIIPLTPSVSPDGMKVAFENAADAAIYVITLKY